MFSVLITIIEVLQKIPSFLVELPSAWTAIMSSPKWLKMALVCLAISVFIGIGLWRIHHAIYTTGYNKAKVVDAVLVENMRETMQQMINGEKKDTAYVQIPLVLPKPNLPSPIPGTVEELSDTVKTRMDSLETLAKTEHSKFLVADSMARFYVLSWTSDYEDSVQSLSMICNPVSKATLAHIAYKIQFPIVPQITTTLDHLCHRSTKPIPHSLSMVVWG